jgi:hypothetical protein
MSANADEHCFVHNPSNGYIWRVAAVSRGWVRLVQLDGRAFHVRPLSDLARFFKTGTGPNAKGEPDAQA